MRKAIIVANLILNGMFLMAQTGKEPVKVTDILKIKNIAGLTLSPDGRKAAFTLTSVEPNGDSKVDFKYVNQVYLVPVDGSAPPRQITSKENASQPAWSPDGKQLAFVRVADGRPQIFILSLEGGEAIQLTKSRYGATGPRWTPDSKKILFSANISLKDLMKDSLINLNKSSPLWPSERTGFSNNDHLRVSKAKPDPDGDIEAIRAYLENDVTDRKARVLSKLNFQDETDVSAEIGFNHLFIVEATPGKEPKAITSGFYDFNGVEFSADGKQLIIVADLDSAEHPDRSLESQVYVSGAEGNNLRLVLGQKDRTYFSPALSPSGRWLAYQHQPTSFTSVATLSLIPMSGTEKDKIDIAFDRNKNNLQWSADEKYLYFTAPSNGGTPLYRVDMQTKKVEQLSDVHSGIGSYDLVGNVLAYVKTSIESPFEIFTADAGMKNPRRLSSFNVDWIKDRKLSFPEKHVFTNEKGMEIEYWVMKPSNYESGKKYPLLLEIHGGPSAMWGPGESSMWHEFQYFTSRGYGVVYANPRGSGGYGAEFLRANVNDWGQGPSRDVLTALDKTIAEGWADTSKLVITGGSYAGYLVAWIIAHDHRFKAACSQRGVYDLSTFFGEGNAWRLVPNYFGGYPWEPKVREVLQRESPINYVQHITTPYIIFHGENDRRTGVIQSEMMYRSLKVLGRPVEYVRHPGATHEITRSGDVRQRIDQMLRTYEFFERFIGRGGVD